MREARKRKMSLADMAVVAAGDPLGWICALLVFGKFWKVGSILLALIAIVGIITGFLILWIKHWDI
jgi:hypothetical protein